MVESYTTGGDTYRLASAIKWPGQTFTPRLDHVISHVDLILRACSSAFPPTVSIYLCDADHKPTGSRLAWSDYIVENHSTFFWPGRVRFKMTPHLLLKGTEYAWVINAQKVIPTQDPMVLYDAGDATYPRGIRIYSPYVGAAWETYPNDDHLFIEFGTPPLMKPEPPPPIDHIAVQDIKYQWYDLGVDFSIATTVPCHLTCYYTDKKPLKHARSRLVRGVEVPWATYFCFVAWQAMEQIEAGDTLYHTFRFNEWPACTMVISEWDLTPGAAPPFWEPWGDTLQENQPWIQNDVFNPIEYTLSEGIIHLFNPPVSGSGIRRLFVPDKMPLVNKSSQPLCFYGKCPWASAPDSKDFITYLLNFRNSGDATRDDLVIARGDYWGAWGTLKAAEHAHSAMDYGLDPGPINLLEHWKWARAAAGDPTDPTGWFLDNMRLVLESLDPPSNAQVKNDTINLFYPSEKIVVGHGNERYFTFRGQVDDIDSPSVGPIFQKCHPGGPPRTTILRPNAPGDLCRIPAEVGDPCPNHFRNVDEAESDENETKVYTIDAYNRTWRYDYYHIEPPPPVDYRIERVTLHARIKRPYGMGYVKTHALVLKLGDTIYGPPPYDWVPTSWTNYSYPLPLCFTTWKPWTRADLIDLQVGMGLYFYRGVGWSSWGELTQMYLEVEYASLFRP